MAEVTGSSPVAPICVNAVKIVVYDLANWFFGAAWVIFSAVSGVPPQVRYGGLTFKLVQKRVQAQTIPNLLEAEVLWWQVQR